MAISITGILFIATGFCGIIALISYHIKRLDLYRIAAKFKGPLALPVIGNALYFLGNNEDILRKSVVLLDSYPSPFILWLGSRLIVVVYDAESLKSVLHSSKCIEKDYVYELMRPLFGIGLITSPADKWRIHRKLIQPTFNKRILESFVEVFAKQSQLMTKHMKKELNNGEFDIFDYVSLCTLDIICATSNTNDGIETSSSSSHAVQNVARVQRDRIILPESTPDESDHAVDYYNPDDPASNVDNSNGDQDNGNTSAGASGGDSYAGRNDSPIENELVIDTSIAESSDSNASMGERADAGDNSDNESVSENGSENGSESGSENGSENGSESGSENGSESGSEGHASSFDSNDDSVSTAPRSDNNDEIGGNERRNNARQNFNDPVMFEVSGLKVSDVLFLIVTFTTRFHLTGKGKEALLELVKTLAGRNFEDAHTINCSSFDQFDPPSNSVSHLFYCDKCDEKLGEAVSKKNIPKEIVACPMCEQEYSLTAESPNSYLFLDVEYQMRLLLENKKIQESLLENIRRIEEKKLAGDNLIVDVQDGTLYKETVRAEDNVIILTIILSTDGAQIFHSSKRSMWALLLIINEFPTSIRFKNVVLAGLWITSSEPKPPTMELYLSEFLDKTARLRERGMTVAHYETEEDLVFKIQPIFVCADSVARPIIQNRLQYNGYYSCSCCYIRGVHFGGIVKYATQADDAPLRSNASHSEDVRNAQITQRIANGVKGPCVFSTLENFDCVWGFPHDYLHGVLLGVTRQMWDLWTTAGTAYYIPPASRTLINRRLIEIKPPLYLHRLPRVLTEKCKWKATEWRSWLLFYSVPCLMGILPEEYFAPYLCLVRGIFGLLRTSITERELQQCEIDLLEFVGSCEVLYGTGAMTYNVHSLLHLTECVRRSGPLWATSTFPFESFIYILKQKIKGPKGVSQQISQKILREAEIRNGSSALCETQVCLDFSEYINDRRQLNTQYTVSEEGVVFIGRRETIEDVRVIRGINVDEAEGVRGTLYNRCVFKKTPWRSTTYTRPMRNNDTVCQLACGTVVEINQFLHHNERAYIIGKKHDVLGFTHNGFELSHIFQSTAISDEVRAYSINDVKHKLIVIKIDRHMYFCVPPNTIEIQ